MNENEETSGRAQEFDSATRQARDKLAAARVWLLRNKPFFGVLARAFRLEPSFATPAFRVLPDDRLLFHPHAVTALRFPALCARVAHLALHPALSAFARGRGRDARRWNVACDLAIAPLLEAAGLGTGVAPPPARLAPDLPRGASAEAYDARLDDGAAPDPLWCDLCEPVADRPFDVLAAPSLGRENEPSAPDASTETRPDEGSGPPEVGLPEAAIELQWRIRLAAAYEEESARGGPTFGGVPGWVDEFLRATIEPPADWSAVLQQSIHLLRRTDRSYLRPSRRMSALAGEDDWPETVSMPGRRVESAGRLVAVVDTSASLDTSTVSRFLGAVVATATAEGIDDVRLLQADAEVTSDEVLFTADLLSREIAISGRGGTDFEPALARLAEEGRRERVRFTVAYLTDLDGRLPPARAASGLDVLWIVPAPPRNAPPFGRVLTMAARTPGSGTR